MVEIVRLLLAKGAKIEARHRGADRQPLQYAVLHESRVCGAAVDRQGADVGDRLRNGSTALHVAANRGHIGNRQNSCWTWGAQGQNARDEDRVNTLWMKLPGRGSAAWPSFIIERGATSQHPTPRLGARSPQCSIVGGEGAYRRDRRVARHRRRDRSQGL